MSPTRTSYVQSYCTPSRSTHFPTRIFLTPVADTEHRSASIFPPSAFDNVHDSVPYPCFVTRFLISTLIAFAVNNHIFNLTQHSRLDSFVPIVRAVLFPSQVHTVHCFGIGNCPRLWLHPSAANGDIFLDLANRRVLYVSFWCIVRFFFIFFYNIFSVFSSLSIDRHRVFFPLIAMSSAKPQQSVPTSEFA